MRKLTPFVLGIAAALAVSDLGGHQARAFAFGVLTAALALIVALGSRRRLQTAARFLNRIASIGTAKASNIIDAPAPAPAPAVDPDTSRRIEEVTSALVNMGMKKQLALKAAGKAAPHHKTFEDAFRAALVLGVAR